jgi:alkyldihydroxyacetonephosphate synthase
MPDVKHMKWWGWGVEGVSFHHEDKPAFRPFVITAIDLDVDTTPTAPMSLEDLPIPTPVISAQLLAELTDAVGAENAAQDDLDRIVHTYGKSARDLLRIRAGDIPRVPDVVLYPGNEAEMQLIVDRGVAADAVIIPYGGGSNIAGSLHAPEDETRPVISLDLGRLNQVIDIDEESGLARIQAGALGPDLEEQLGAAGLVSGALPRQLYPQHARRLGSNALIGDAVG